MQNGRCGSLLRFLRLFFFFGSIVAFSPLFAQNPLRLEDGAIFNSHREPVPSHETLSAEGFQTIHAEFINDLYLASKHRQLTPAQTEHPGFQSFVAWFQHKHKDFPLNSPLAHAWAIGDEQLAERLAVELRYTPPATKPSGTDSTRAQLRALGQQVLALVRAGISWAQRTCAGYPVLFGGIGAGIVMFVAARTLHPRRPAHSSRIVGKQAAYTVVFNSARNETIFLPMKTDFAPQLIIADTASSGETVQARAEPESLCILPMDMQWENQLRATEKRAEQLLAEVRAGLAPHLARQMTSELVRKLVDDRTTLLETQKLACAQVATLEQRFARIHAELQERLRDYQTRNIQLEKQLAERTDQNRQLLSTQIATLQKKLQ